MPHKQTEDSGRFPAGKPGETAQALPTNTDKSGPPANPLVLCLLKSFELKQTDKGHCQMCEQKVQINETNIIESKL